MTCRGFKETLSGKLSFLTGNGVTVELHPMLLATDIETKRR